MPKMWNRDAGNVGLDLYLYCKKHRNNPRIHHSICENTCRYFKNCPYYSIWRDNSNKEDTFITNKKGVKKRNRKKPKLKRKTLI